MSVTPNMIAVALGQTAPVPGSVQEQQWELWIDDAAMLIEARRIKLDPALIIDEARLDYVVRQSVVAHIKKPDDATQVTVSVDDASTSRTYQSGKGRITIADEWWELLGLVEKQQGAFSVDMVPNGGNSHLPWCASNFGAIYCSCGADIADVPIFEGGRE
jgi:hypothetical protein